MKLLGKKDIQDVKRGQMGREISLAKKVQGATEEIRKSFNDTKSELSAETQKITDDFFAFAKDIESKRTELMSTVIELETKKEEAMKPVDALYSEAENVLQSNKKKEEQLDINILNHSVEREADKAEALAVSKEKVNNTLLTNTLDERSKDVILKEAELKIDKEQFISQKQTYDEDYSKRTQHLDTEEYNLKQKEIALNNERNALSVERDRLGQEWRVVSDQRATLERAMARLKK